ncbi:MAG: menaquinone biosynthesis protein [Verrucomicrobiota bacterium]|jgi:predicted solute-binding protein
MTPIPRIGCVPYLNARPLLEGLEELNLPVLKLVPSKLYDAYKSSKLDAALLSSIDVINSPSPCVVDGVSISSKGDVHSVVLAYMGDLQKIKKVSFDPSSHTSNALLRIVLEQFLQIYPEYVQNTEEISNKSARLMIGDPALAYRKETMGSDIRFLDLGGEWFRKTGLPFVFALWLLKSDLTKKKELSKLLRNAKSRGLLERQAIALLEPDPEFALHYLRDFIHFNLGEEEKRGLKLFGEYLRILEISIDHNHEIRYF